MLNDLHRPARKWSRAAEIGDEGFDFRVVEDHAVGLIAEEAGAAFGVDFGNFRTRDVHFFALDVPTGEGGGGEGEQVVDLVPGQPFVAGDVEIFADGAAMAEQAVEAFGEVGVVGEGPEGRAVAGDADGLVVEDAVEDCVAGIEREQGFVVGVGGADDGDGVFLFAVGAGEAFFAGDFVT